MTGDIIQAVVFTALYLAAGLSSCRILLHDATARQAETIGWRGRVVIILAWPSLIVLIPTIKISSWLRSRRSAG